MCPETWLQTFTSLAKLWGLRDTNFKLSLGVNKMTAEISGFHGGDYKDGCLLG
jgi:hypothetical protein